MSLLVELSGKGGRVCSRDYRKGNNCPCVVRSSSEDLFTSSVFGVLRHLRPSLWLRPMLSSAFGKRFNTCPMTDLSVRFWPKLPPPSIVREGYSEPDLMVTFADTVVLIEMKYRSPLATKTTHDKNRDQLVRLLDVAYEFGIGTRFGEMRSRPYVMVLGLPRSEPSLVSKYRCPEHLQEALSHYARFPDHAERAELLSRQVGYLSWSSLAEVLSQALIRAQKLERLFLQDLVTYIRFKVKTADLRPDESKQAVFPFATKQDLPLIES